MRRTAIAAAAALCLAPLVAVPIASASPGLQYVNHVQWAKWGDLSSLRVFPTTAARKASGLASVAQGEQAWAEVLTLAPDADIPGMKPQFICHWEFAELSEPGKSSWNLEPWRPEVSDEEMVQAGCNPGGTEEPF